MYMICLSEPKSELHLSKVKQLKIQAKGFQLASSVRFLIIVFYFISHRVTVDLMACQDFQERKDTE